MPVTLSPGIYVEEVASLPQPINLASTGAGSTCLPAVQSAPTHGVSLLRYFPAQGTQIWSSRSTSGDPAWQSDAVRSLSASIVQSITQASQWAVFENNGPVLWAALVSSIESFLTQLWQSGSLKGKKKREAFFVRCDNTTMTQNDIDNGRFVALVGFAPVKPAEFVILRITGQTKKK